MFTAEVVHVYPGNEPYPGGPPDCEQPLAGLVLRDNGDSTVAVKVFAPNGEDFYRSRVILTDRETAKAMPGFACCVADEPVNRQAATPIAGGAAALGGAAGWGGQNPTQPPQFVPPREEIVAVTVGGGGSAPAETPPAAPTVPAGEPAGQTAAGASPSTNAGVTGD